MAMNPDAPKENANPSIRAVDKERSHARRTPFEWSQIGSFKRVEGGDDSNRTSWIPTSAEDRAILKALVDVSKATHGKGVNLLQNAGLTIPHSTKDVLKYPHFQVEEESKIEESPKSQGEIGRDKIDAEEVFDIIRNIQDPEHPNALEELGVVSLGHVEVTDEGPSVEGAPCVKSYVNVRFT
jgi:hypothetical protein